MPSPVKVTLEVGKEYVWCNCGLMDGICPQTDGELDSNWCESMLLGGRAKRFTSDRTEAYVCTCLQTKTWPFCDGSHKTVKDG